MTTLFSTAIDAPAEREVMRRVAIAAGCSAVMYSIAAERLYTQCRDSASLRARDRVMPMLHVANAALEAIGEPAMQVWP